MKWELIRLGRDTPHPGIYWYKDNKIIKVYIEQVAFNKIKYKVEKFDINEDLLDDSQYIRTSDSFQSYVLDKMDSPNFCYTQEEFDSLVINRGDDEDSSPSVRVGVFCSLVTGSFTSGFIIGAKLKKKAKRNKATYLGDAPVDGQASRPVIFTVNC